jgi:peptidoglycan-N-acetylglucosamine deacetylase
MFGKLYLVCLLGLTLCSSINAREIALTFDDAPTPDTALMTGQERTEKLIAALQSVDVDDALFFVKADYLNAETKKRLEQYAKAGFHIANHSYRHRSAEKLPNDEYLADVYRAHLLIKDLPNFLPYHHPGKDKNAIHYLQQELTQMGYREGYINVDNFDWYISAP